MLYSFVITLCAKNGYSKPVKKENFEPLKNSFYLSYKKVYNKLLLCLLLSVESGSHWAPYPLTCI